MQPEPEPRAYFAKNLVSRVGPRRDGFWLRVWYDKPDGDLSGCSWDVPEYFGETRSGGFPISLPPPDDFDALFREPSPVLGFVLRCGSGVDREFRHRIVMALVK